MKPTHQQLLQAARDAGGGGESFSCADIRQRLGVATKDRKKLDQFYRTFRAFQAAASAEIEKIGPNCYRLVTLEAELSSETIEPAVIELDSSELREVSDVAERELALPPELPEAALIAAASAAAEVSEASDASNASSTDTPREPTAIPAWRGHMRRFGRRVRRLFGASTTSAGMSREAGAAAQA